MYNIPVVKSYKYLGVEIDNKGNIGEYIEKIKNKTIKKAKTLYPLLKNLSMRKRLTLFKCYAEPLFQYVRGIIDL